MSRAIIVFGLTVHLKLVRPSDWRWRLPALQPYRAQFALGAVDIDITIGQLFSP
jgi:hypothetical protein